MVKLLRLTSTDDCNFVADLDAGIKLGEDASIGLQNLTFESIDFTTFTMGGDRTEIKFSQNQQPQIPPGNAEPPIFFFNDSSLESKSYTSTTINDFYADLEATLNECCIMNEQLIVGNAYSSFRVAVPSRNNNLDKIVIVYKLTPMIMMFNQNEDGEPYVGRLQLFNNSKNGDVRGDMEIETSDKSNDGTNLGNLNLQETLSATSERKHYVFPSENAFGGVTNVEAIKWSKGSGMFMVRVADVVDNTGAADTNGFSIGLASRDIEQQTNNGTKVLPTEDIFFEVRIKRPTDPYEVIIPSGAGVPSVTTTSPHRVALATGLTNDLILFEKNGNIVTAKIKQSNPQLDDVIINVTLTREQMKLDLYPYICVFGEKTKALVGFPNLTIDGIINPMDIDGSNYNNDKLLITGDTQEIMGTFKNCFEIMADQGFTGIVPEPDNLWWTNDNYIYQSAEPVLKINGSVLRLLGYSNDLYPNNIEYSIKKPDTLIPFGEFEPPFDANAALRQFNLIPNGLPDLTNSDNYIVLLDSNPLFSYDASKFDYNDQNNVSGQINNTKRGRRKSILATIPVNNNSGTVEYRANDPIYIDFDNRFPQELKNLRLRVLDKNFGEVRTTGESVITLLLKDN